MRFFGRPNEMAWGDDRHLMEPLIIDDVAVVTAAGDILATDVFSESSNLSRIPIDGVATGAEFVSGLHEVMIQGHPHWVAMMKHGAKLSLVEVVPAEESRTLQQKTTSLTKAWRVRELVPLDVDTSAVVRLVTAGGRILIAEQDGGRLFDVRAFDSSPSIEQIGKDVVPGASRCWIKTFSPNGSGFLCRFSDGGDSRRDCRLVSKQGGGLTPIVGQTHEFKWVSTAQGLTYCFMDGQGRLHAKPASWSDPIPGIDGSAAEDDGHVMVSSFVMPDAGVRPVAIMTRPNQKTTIKFGISGCDASLGQWSRSEGAGEGWVRLFGPVALREGIVLGLSSSETGCVMLSLRPAAITKVGSSESGRSSTVGEQA
jgi:hypothetical protein